MSRPFNLCLRIVGAVHLNDNGSLAKKILICVAQNILKDGSHVLHVEFDKLPGGHRWRVSPARTNRFKKSFIPRSSAVLNIS